MSSYQIFFQLDQNQHGLKDIPPSTNIVDESSAQSQNTVITYNLLITGKR